MRKLSTLFASLLVLAALSCTALTGCNSSQDANSGAAPGDLPKDHPHADQPKDHPHADDAG